MKKALSLILLGILIFSSSGFTSTSALPPVYRTIDGSGNNLSNPSWGKPLQQLFRMASSDYFDDKSIPRGNDPSTLPSARAISNKVVAQISSIPNPQGASDMLWQWGQIMDHDLDLTTPSSGAFNIIIPPDDLTFTLGSTMPLTRSSFDGSTGTTNPREQINQVTAFIDGSMVYGSDKDRNDFIRDLAANNGKLKLDSNGLLPLNTINLPNGNGPNPANIMFVAGDVRVNEQAGLTVLHTLLVREHNRLVDEIKLKTGITNANTLYEEAKIILEGEIQHITYNEFLPILLGQNYMPAPYSGYHPNVNPQVANEFSTAGFRVGHTLLSSELERFNEDGTIHPKGHLSLKAAFFNPQIVKLEGIEPILRGLAVGKSEKIDNFVIDEVRNFLFGEPALMGGFDLASLNIQRGREHGLPSYNQFRSDLGLGSKTTFDAVTGGDQVLAAKLASVYASVDDIDLWVGGLSEPPVSGGMVGETFAIILQDQFERVRDGDRYWYQNRGLNSMQLDMIEHTLLSDIIRRNTDIESIQQNVFLAMDRVAADLDNDGMPDATDPDDDGDGISDMIDTMPITPSNSFSDGETTFGHITSRGGQTVTISDETSPAGVLVSAEGSGAPATVSSCGVEATISFDSGDSAVITCGSVTISVVTGSVVITFDMGDGLMTTILTGGSITFDPNSDFLSVITEPGTTGTIEIDGVVTPLEGNQRMTFDITHSDNSQVIGGKIIQLDTTSLLLAGIQTSLLWILPVILVGSSLTAIKLRKR
ncbi:MAG: peroxidase family protein [Nitrososphaeraceae archaeon]